jgi:hypothetical protein
MQFWGDTKQRENGFMKYMQIAEIEPVNQKEEV